MDSRNLNPTGADSKQPSESSEVLESSTALDSDKALESKKVSESKTAPDSELGANFSESTPKPIALGELFSLSLRDYTSPKILLMTFLPCLVCFVALMGLLFVYGQDVADYLWEWAASFGPEWLSGGIVGSVLSGLLSLFVALILGMLVVILSLLANLFASIFYTPFIVAYVNKMHYPSLALSGFGDFLGTLVGFGKILGVFGILFVLCVPLYFVPLLGGVILFGLGYFFFQKSMFYDIGSTMLSHEQFATLKSSARVKNHTATLLAYLLSFVPLFNFFAMPLQILFLVHYFCARITQGLESTKN